jgi:FtsH-binding integral membrane protein
MRAKQLFIVRVALVAGVGAFAALAAYQRARVGTISIDLTASGQPVPLDLLRYVLWGLAGMALAGAVFLRSRIEVARPAQRGAMLVVGWALGEGVALFGTVQHFIGAPLVTMAIGLLTFVVVLILLPIPAERS